MKRYFFIFLGLLFSFGLGFCINFYYLKTSTHPSFYKITEKPMASAPLEAEEFCNINIEGIKENKIFGRVDSGSLKLNYKGQPIELKADGTFEVDCK